MADLRRSLEVLVPSLVAACVAAVVVGGLEGMAHLDGGVRALASVGFLCILAVPVGFVGGLLVRGLWWAWQVDRAVDAARTETGGVPSVAAWLLFVAIAVLSVFAYAFNVVWTLSWLSGTKQVAALASALLLVLGMLAVFVLSRPVVRGMSWGLDRFDRRLHRVLGRSVMTPRWLLGYVLVGSLATAIGSWYLTIEPRIGDFEIGPLLYLVLFVALILTVSLGWPLLRRRPAVARVAALGWTAAALALVATALVVRFQQPYTMLEVWGEAPLAGDVVDRVWDVQGLRGELELEGFTPVARPGADHPDVILVTIDTVRADRTPLLGGRAKMPALLELSKEGTSFRWAFSPSNVTRRSLPTIATGLSPRRMRGRVAGWALRMDPRHVTLAERLRSGGYDTAGFFCCGSQFGRRHKLGLIRGLDHVYVRYDGNELTAEAVAWMRARRAAGATKPLFLWIHYIEPHRWNQTYKRSDHGADIRRRYDLSLEAVDGMLAVLFAELRSAENRDRTIVTVTSDHGEGLSEGKKGKLPDRENKFHSTNLYNEQIRVPLVIVGPGVQARKIDENVGLVSVAPTLLDLAGFEPPTMPQMDGPSLAPMLRGQRKPDMDSSMAHAVMIPDRSNKRRRRALIHGRYKVMEGGDGGALRLYDLRRDPRERKDLAAKKPEVLARMKALLDQRSEVEAVSPF